MGNLLFIETGQQEKAQQVSINTKKRAFARIKLLLIPLPTNSYGHLALMRKERNCEKRL